MTFVGADGYAMSPVGTSRGAVTRGRIQNGVGYGMAYPNPFFDVAHTYLPTSIKSLFHFTRYYFMTNGFMHTTAYKAALYPITDTILEHEDLEVQKKWTTYWHEHLRWRPFQVEIGLDKNVYGNSFVTISYPFNKYLRCKHCGFQEEATRIKQHWSFVAYEFRLTCPKCQHVENAEVSWINVRNASGIRLVRWNPEDIDIAYNEVTGEYQYYYNMSKSLRNDIVMGKKDIVATIPQVYITAAKEGKSIKFAPGQIFHMKRPSLADTHRGWGIPQLLPVLKDAFGMQVIKKANECVAPSTLVDTSTGLVEASALRVGDLVKTHVGSFQPITGLATRKLITDNGEHGVRLTLSGMRDLPSTFSDNHPMWVLRRNSKNIRKDSKKSSRSCQVLCNPSLYDFQWVDATDVSAGDYVGYPTQRERSAQRVDVAKYTELAHDGTDAVCTARTRMPRFLELTEDLAYIAGWYLGDGSIGARRVDFSMGPDDDGSELSNAIERVFGVKCTRQQCKKSNGWMLVASGTILSLLMQGWIPGNAKTKRIPEEILRSSDSVVLAFLRGYLAADGYTRVGTLKQDRITVCCANKQLTYQLWQLAISFGCIATVSESVSYDTNIKQLDGTVVHLEAGRPVYNWSVCSASAKRLLNLMKGVAAEAVKTGKSGFFVHGYFAARVQAAEKVECPDVVSIEVAGEHTFCVPGMATHNTLLLEHILPLRTIFPQAASGSSDPFSSVSLVDWRDHVAKEISQWRADPNYIPILPLPIGQQTIGGDGRSLLLTPEIQQAAEHLVVGMGYPKEFIWGGASWAGTNVSMRMVENMFIGDISDHLALAKWVMQQISTYMEWPKALIRFKPFRMADDLQRKALMLQVNQANKLSDTSLMAELDYDQNEENKIMIREADTRIEATKRQQLAMADIQGESQLIMAKYQAKAQQVQQQAMAAGQAPGEPGGPEQQAAGGAPGGDGGAPTPLPQELQQGTQEAPSAQQPASMPDPQTPYAGQTPQQPGLAQQQSGLDIVGMAQMHARMIASMPPEQQQAAIQNLQTQSPELASLVMQMLQGMQGQQPQADNSANAPLPEKRAPRRDFAK